MIEGSSKEEFENAENDRQEKLVGKGKEKPITFLQKSTTEKQEKISSTRALNKNTEKKDEKENEKEWHWVEHEIQTISIKNNGTKVFETKSHVGKRMKQVVQTLKDSIRTSVKKRTIKRRQGTNPVSDWTYKTCIKNEYKSEYDSDDILSSETRAQKEGTEKTEFKPVSKISIDKRKERNANRHAAPYSATSGTMKSSNKIKDDTNDCNNYGVKKQTVIPFWAPAMWKETAEQDVAVNSTPNTTINKYRKMKIVLPRNSSLLRAKKIETVEIENNNQMNKPKYDKSGSETKFQTSKSASANAQDHDAGMDFVQDRCSSSSIPPDLISECKTLRITDTTQCLLKENLQTKDEVFTGRKKGKKEVLSVEDKVLTEEANRIKEVPPVEDKLLTEEANRRKEVPLVEDKVLTEEANRRKNIPPAEDEVFLEEEKGTKNVLSLQEEVCIEEANRRKEGLLEGMLTYGTNKRKQVLPGRIENHKESPEIIILQEERKSITLLLTACQPDIQRLSKTMLNQTISPAASTEEKQHQFFSFVVVDLIGRVSIFRTSSLFFLCDSFVSSEKDNINLGEVWKALRDPVLQNLSIWPHGRMVKTYDSTQTDWLTELYDGTRSSVYNYNYKFSFLFFVQFRLTSSHWQDVVKKNVQFVNPLVMTEHIRSPKKNGNTYNHPKNSIMSLIFHHNDDPGPCQRILSQSSLQTEIVKSSLHFDANTKSEGNAMSKSPVLQAIGKLVDNGVLMKYVAYYTQKNYGRKNGIDPNCKTFEILFFDENIQKKTPTRIVKTLLDFDVNKENAPVLQAMEKELEASHTGFVWLEYRAEADTEPQKYDRQDGTQIDRKTFDARPQNGNTPTKTSERVKLCIVSEANDETRCMSRPIKDEGSYFIYLNSIAINKQVTASKPTSAKLYPVPNIYQIDGKLSTVSETNDETRCMMRPMENEGSYFIYLNFNSIAINKQVTASKPTCAELYPALNMYQGDGKLCTVSETNDETRCMMRPMENEGSYFIYLNSIAINKQVPASKTTCAKLDSAPNIHQRDHVYCTEGSNDLPVERYDEESNQWKFVEPTPRLVKKTSAAVVNNRIYVADDKGVLCYDIQKDSWSEINLSCQWHFVKGDQVKIPAVNETLYIIRNESVFKNAMYLLRPVAGQMTLVKDVKDNAFFNNIFFAVPEKRPTAEEVLNETQRFDLRVSIFDSKKEKFLDTYLNEVDVITGTEKSGPFLKNKAVPIKAGRRRVVRERREFIAVNKEVSASKLTCAELHPAPNIYQRVLASEKYHGIIKGPIMHLNVTVGSKFNRSDDRFPACNIGPFGELRRQFARHWHWKMDFQQPSKARQFKVKSWRNYKMIKSKPPECQVQQSSVELTTARTIQGREEEGAPTKNKAEPFSEYLNAPISELHELCVLCGYRSGEHACFRSRRGSRRAFGDDSQSNDALAVNTRNLIWTQTASVLHTTQSNIPTSDQDHPSNQLLEYLNAPISELHELCVLCGHRSGEHVCFRSRVTVERPWIIDPRAFNDQNQV